MVKGVLESPLLRRFRRMARKTLNRAVRSLVARLEAPEVDMISLKLGVNEITAKFTEIAAKSDSNSAVIRGLEDRVASIEGQYKPDEQFVQFQAVFDTTLARAEARAEEMRHQFLKLERKILQQHAEISEYKVMLAHMAVRLDWIANSDIPTIRRTIADYASRLLDYTARTGEHDSKAAKDRLAPATEFGLIRHLATMDGRITNLERWTPLLKRADKVRVEFRTHRTMLRDVIARLDAHSIRLGALQNERRATVRLEATKAMDADKPPAGHRHNMNGSTSVIYSNGRSEGARVNESSADTKEGQ